LTERAITVDVPVSAVALAGVGARGVGAGGVRVTQVLARLALVDVCGNERGMGVVSGHVAQWMDGWVSVWLGE
jgi:hypothetical protein